MPPKAATSRFVRVLGYETQEHFATSQDVLGSVAWMSSLM
ncbi:MAG: hypothetical protein AVDCRST_MAG52-1501 [uncultured Blastococcus sp.]|uniref:Uncharacterized protein n=1 Tax=uncultured Blastococcus sp. TaxID=217144 RepID=A0A6J4I3G5_9ACTN|nr:MAG: hypothetical protein AVDCRST_MAG52-1501 [uncultured Blastococcus sp.]